MRVGMIDATIKFYYRTAYCGKRKGHDRIFVFELTLNGKVPYEWWFGYTKTITSTTVVEVEPASPASSEAVESLSSIEALEDIIQAVKDRALTGELSSRTLAGLYSMVERVLPRKTPVPKRTLAIWLVSGILYELGLERVASPIQVKTVPKTMIVEERGPNAVDRISRDLFDIFDKIADESLIDRYSLSVELYDALDTVDEGISIVPELEEEVNSVDYVEVDSCEDLNDIVSMRLSEVRVYDGTSCTGALRRNVYLEEIAYSVAVSYEGELESVVKNDVIEWCGRWFA